MNNIHRGAAALLCGLCSSIAYAQSAVTVYGLVDSGLVHTTNANAAGDSITKMPSLTSSFPSRIGFRGVEDLGGGLQAVFTLESGLALDTGAMGQGARLFGRQASVGLKGRWGALTLGRQINMTYLAGIKTDVLGPHLFSIGSIDGYLPNARSDNAIGYLGTFGSSGTITAGATYSFGRDASSAGGPAATNCPGETAGNSKACRQVTALLGYDNKRLGATVSYDILYGNTGAAAGLASSANSDRRVTVNAYAMAGTVKVGGGAIVRDTRAATGLTESALYYLGASMPSGSFTIDGQLAYRDTKGSGADVGLAVLRGTYNLSVRSAVYASAGRMHNKGTSAVALDAGGSVGVGMSQNGVAAGLRHTF